MFCKDPSLSAASLVTKKSLVLKCSNCAVSSLRPGVKDGMSVRVWSLKKKKASLILPRINDSLLLA